MIDGLPTARGCPFNPPAGLAELRDKEPLTRMRYPDGHVGWLVTGHELAREVLTNEAFSARHELRHYPVPFPVKLGAAAPGVFIGMDPPAHTRYRSPLSRAFTTRRVKALEPSITRICAETLDAMERQGSPADLMRAFAFPFPVLVISALLGATAEVAAEFQRLRVPVLSPDTPPEEVGTAVKRTDELMRELVALKRARPGDDLLTALIAEDVLRDDELAGIALLLLGAGHETTANMIALTALLLLEDPGLRASLDTSGNLSVIVANELLRYLSVVQFVSRSALTDVELGGVTVKAGETVTISLSAANRDGDRFISPDTITLGGPPVGQLAFGYGLHQCIGHNLARAEIQIGVPALLRRFPGLRLDVPAAQLPTREAMNTFGLHRLPVAW
jgi:cytochrome P450